jgi:long-subunit acyl-CoA synthetase (AMP-forming)
MKSYERPSTWLPIIHPFSQENQMLTPKMSLRRNTVVKAYQNQIDQLLKGTGNKVQYPK